MQLGVRRRGWLGAFAQRSGRMSALLFLAALFAGTSGNTGFAQSEEVPRTPWGDPDLQGVWDFLTTTPLERPEGQANEVLTGEAAVT